MPIAQPMSPMAGPSDNWVSPDGAFIPCRSPRGLAGV
jgi:hypothetical protein